MSKTPIADKHPSLIDIEQLKLWSGYKRGNEIVNFLIENRIPYWQGKDGQPMTTLEAVNNKLLPDTSTEREIAEFI